jgi:hypothetical protein
MAVDLQGIISGKFGIALASILGWAGCFPRGWGTPPPI